MAGPVATLAGIAHDLVLKREEDGSRGVASNGRARWIAIGIFATALLIRLAFLAAHPKPLTSDEVDYDRLGWTLAKTGTYSIEGQPTAYRPVGYPAFVAAVYAVAGRHPVAVKAVQAICDSGTAVLLFFLFARRNRRAGLLAGWTWATLPAAVLFSSQLFSETLLVFGLVTFLYLLDGQPSNQRVAWAAGLLLGALELIKPALVLFLVALPFAWRGTISRRQVATVLALACALMALWVGRNALVMGSPVITTSVGPNLLVGNNPRATGGYSAVPSGIAPPRSGETSDDHVAAGAAAAYVASAPLRSLETAVKKVLFLATSEGELVVGHFASGESSTPFRERFKAVPAWIHLLVSVPSALLLILGGVGLLTRRPDSLSRLFLALLFATLLSSIVFFGGSRFRFPLMPLLAGFSSELVAEWQVRVAAFTRERLALAAALVGAYLAIWTGELVLLGVFR
jgi:hypothetical protein